MTRHQMVVGPLRCYRIVYDLKPGDIFRFRARHKAVNVYKERVRAQTKNWSINDLEDFPKGTHIVWTGGDWLTPFGHFLPRRYWWQIFMVEADPVSVQVPRKVQLNVVKDAPKRVMQMEPVVVLSVKPGLTLPSQEKPVTFFDKIRKFFE